MELFTFTSILSMVFGLFGILAIVRKDRFMEKTEPEENHNAYQWFIVGLLAISVAFTFVSLYIGNDCISHLHSLTNS